MQSAYSFRLSFPFYKQATLDNICEYKTRSPNKTWSLRSYNKNS